MPLKPLKHPSLRDAGQGGGVSHILLLGRSESDTRVPEPGTLTLLGLGFLGAAAWARRRSA